VDQYNLNQRRTSFAGHTGAWAMQVELSAEECRDRARACFGLAVAEADEKRREHHLRDGEMWMSRWRLWTPGNAPVAYVSGEAPRAA